MRAAELHARAVLASEGGRPVRAGKLLRRALDLPDATGALRVRILISLALSESEQGDLDCGLEVLSEAEQALATLLDGEDARAEQLAGLVAGQTGLLLLRVGRFPDAVAQLEAAIPRLAAEPVQQARALLNRGTAALLQGELAAAATALDRAVRTATDAGWDVGRAKAVGNLGYLALLTGDLPEALRLTDEADAVLVPLGGGVDGVSRVNRARMLMAAGLLSDAREELRSAAALLRGARLTQDRAEAELNLAQVALAEGRPGEARRWARSASRQFTARGSTAWALQCDLTLLQADREQGRRLNATADAAARVAEQLRRAGLTEDARTAELIRADCRVAAGCEVEPPRLLPGERIGTRLLARSVRADRAASLGAHGAAARERARGLVELHRYQARFGSLDLQSGASGLGRRLAADGLRVAVRSGRARQVLAWSERARATTSRTPALRPPADPVAAELLADLRYVRTTLREADLAGRDDAGTRRLRARRRELERTIRRRSWYASGPGEIEDAAGLADVRAALAAAPSGPGTLVSYLTVDDHLHALVVTPTRATLHPLCTVADVADGVQRARADLDVLALSRIPPAVRDVARRSLTRSLDVLQRLVWAPLQARGSRLEDGPVVVVPSAAVAALPWTSLPVLRGRAVSVAPSATWWLSSRARGCSVPTGSRALFVAGPGVQRGPAEVTAGAAVWPGADVLVGPDATGSAVLTAVEDASVWHVAAHGSHDNDNPLFSSLQLADGALFGYDLDCVGRLPQHVVLSACDLGLSTVRRRDEALGMTAALLHGGAVSVVAGTARVSDEAAFEVGVRLHERLRGGAVAADALAGALCDAADSRVDSPPPLVCFGAGW